MASENSQNAARTAARVEVGSGSIGSENGAQIEISDNRGDE